MKRSAIQNICTIAEVTLQRFCYDAERLGFTKEEIDEMRRFIKAIETKDDFARLQMSVDIMRVVDDYCGK